jgi:hypothetical protein
MGKYFFLIALFFVSCSTLHKGTYVAPNDVLTLNGRILIGDKQHILSVFGGACDEIKGAPLVPETIFVLVTNKWIIVYSQNPRLKTWQKVALFETNRVDPLDIATITQPTSDNIILELKQEEKVVSIQYVRSFDRKQGKYLWVQEV